MFEGQLAPPLAGSKVIVRIESRVSVGKLAGAPGLDDAFAGRELDILA